MTSRPKVFFTINAQSKQLEYSENKWKLTLLWLNVATFWKIVNSVSKFGEIFYKVKTVLLDRYPINSAFKVVENHFSGENLLSS